MRGRLVVGDGRRFRLGGTGRSQRRDGAGCSGGLIRSWTRRISAALQREQPQPTD